MHRYCALLILTVLAAPAILNGQQAATPACDPDNGGLKLPAGFCAKVVTDEVGFARHLAVAPNGDIFVALRNMPNLPGGIVGLRDTNGDGRADVRERFGDTGGTGLVLHNGYLYLAQDFAVVRFPIKTGELKPSGPAETVVSGFPDQRVHPTKTLAFDTRGGLYVNVGLRANACTEPDQTRTDGLNPCTYLENGGGVWRFDANRAGQVFGNDGRRYSTGLRQTNAMAWDPAGNTLFLVQHGRAGLNRWTEYYPPDVNAEHVGCLSGSSLFFWNMEAHQSAAQVAGACVNDVNASWKCGRNY